MTCEEVKAAISSFYNHASEEASLFLQEWQNCTNCIPVALQLVAESQDSIFVLIGGITIQKFICERWDELSTNEIEQITTLLIQYIFSNLFSYGTGPFNTTLVTLADITILNSGYNTILPHFQGQLLIKFITIFYEQNEMHYKFIHKWKMSVKTQSALFNLLPDVLILLESSETSTEWIELYKYGLSFCQNMFQSLQIDLRSLPRFSPENNNNLQEYLENEKIDVFQFLEKEVEQVNEISKKENEEVKQILISFYSFKDRIREIANSLQFPNEILSLCYSILETIDECETDEEILFNQEIIEIVITTASSLDPNEFYYVILYSWDLIFDFCSDFLEEYPELTENVLNAFFNNLPLISSEDEQLISTLSKASTFLDTASQCFPNYVISFLEYLSQLLDSSLFFNCSSLSEIVHQIEIASPESFSLYINEKMKSPTNSLFFMIASSSEPFKIKISDEISSIFLSIKPEIISSRDFIREVGIFSDQFGEQLLQIAFAESVFPDIITSYSVRRPTWILPYTPQICEIMNQLQINDIMEILISMMTLTSYEPTLAGFICESLIQITQNSNHTNIFSFLINIVNATPNKTSLMFQDTFIQIFNMLSFALLEPDIQEDVAQFIYTSLSHEWVRDRAPIVEWICQAMIIHPVVKHFLVFEYLYDLFPIQPIIELILNFDMNSNPQIGCEMIDLLQQLLKKCERFWDFIPEDFVVSLLQLQFVGVLNDAFDLVIEVFENETSNEFKSNVLCIVLNNIPIYYEMQLRHVSRLLLAIYNNPSQNFDLISFMESNGFPYSSDLCEAVKDYDNDRILCIMKLYKDTLTIE